MCNTYIHSLICYKFESESWDLHQNYKFILLLSSIYTLKSVSFFHFKLYIRRFWWEYFLLGELSDSGGLAEKEGSATPSRITPRNSTDVEKTSTSHESLRTDLHETLPTA